MIQIKLILTHIIKVLSTSCEIIDQQGNRIISIVAVIVGYYIACKL